MAWIVLVLGVSASIAAALNVESAEEREARYEFQAAVAESAAAIEFELNRYEDALLSARGLFVASRHVTWEEFEVFARALALDDRYAGAKGLALVSAVPARRLVQLERRLRADDEPLAVNQAGAGRELFLAAYLAGGAPFGRGSDLSRAPTARAGLERARDESATRRSAPPRRADADDARKGGRRAQAGRARQSRSS